MTLLSWFGWMDSIKEWGETGDVNFSSLPASATGQYDRLYNAIAEGDTDNASGAMAKLEAMGKDEKTIASQLKNRLKKYSPEVEQAADTLALADLNVYQDTLILVLLQPNSDHPNNVAKATLYRSDDLGAHWQEQKMNLPALGLQEEEQLADAFLNFWSEQCGSLILETDQARRSVLLTSDGGLTWNKLEDLTGEDGDAWMCGGGFVSEQLGFLATTDQHQLEPRLYQTRDGGATWEKMPMELPTLTGLLRAEALTPQRAEDGAIVIPVRVYQQRSGGQWVHILQYISRDEGLTWDFAQQEG